MKGSGCMTSWSSEAAGESSFFLLADILNTIAEQEHYITIEYKNFLCYTPSSKIANLLQLSDVMTSHASTSQTPIQQPTHIPIAFSAQIQISEQPSMITSYHASLYLLHKVSPQPCSSWSPPPNQHGSRFLGRKTMFEREPTVLAPYCTSGELLPRSSDSSQRIALQENFFHDQAIQANVLHFRRTSSTIKRFKPNKTSQSLCSQNVLLCNDDTM
ncbi:hypothetical protein NE237_032180 [Protea cynaroides]|uniref:Uncharacterized protein n=1 Tax=Protea cynaroides TaxID=273540 RepID=A0A9Q0R2V3_9MAGN|nr:hypothetical protein NE237_032180 [Protea cynaroides]